jgi:hypothetical protein
MKTAGEIAFAVWSSDNGNPCDDSSLPNRERRRRASAEPFFAWQLGSAENFISPIDVASGGCEAWRGRFERCRAALSR